MEREKKIIRTSIVGILVNLVLVVFKAIIGVIVENIDAPLKDYTLEWNGTEMMEGPLYGSSFTIGKGERFAQMRLIEIPLVNWLPVSSLGSFENDHGKGFGSTGTK